MVMRLIPSDDPPRAGFTNNGRSSWATRLRAASRLCCQSASVMVTQGPTFSPAYWYAIFMKCLSMPTAEASTPAPSYGTPSVSKRPWTVPSSPLGPCSSGKATSMVAMTLPSTSTSWVSELTLRRATGDSVSGTSGSVSDRAVVWVLSAGCWLVSVATDHSVFSGWWLPASTQSPRWLIPTGMGVYWPVSSALSTPTAVTMDTGCSGDWPPNNTRTVLV